MEPSRTGGETVQMTSFNVKLNKSHSEGILFSYRVLQGSVAGPVLNYILELLCQYIADSAKTRLNAKTQVADALGLH